MENDFSGYWVQIPNFVVNDKNLSDKALKVLCVLSTYINNTGFGWPKQKTLAERCNCGRLTISRAIKELIDAGYVTATNLYREDEGQTVNAYSITYNKKGDVSKMIHRCIKNDTGGCIKNDTGGVSKMIHMELDPIELDLNFKKFKKSACARTHAREVEEHNEYEDQINETDEERFIEIEREMHEVFTKREEWLWIKAVEFWKIGSNEYHVYTGTQFITEKLQDFDFEGRFLAMESVRGLEFTFGTNFYDLPAEYYKLNKTA